VAELRPRLVRLAGEARDRLGVPRQAG
jgi:hypothetical protein